MNPAVTDPYQERSMTTATPGHLAGLVIPVVGVGIAAEFIGTFPAVLALSILLAVLCIVALARITTTVEPGRGEDR